MNDLNKCYFDVDTLSAYAKWWGGVWGVPATIEVAAPGEAPHVDETKPGVLTLRIKPGLRTKDEADEILGELFHEYSHLLFKSDKLMAEWMKEVEKQKYTDGGYIEQLSLNAVLDVADEHRLTTVSPYRVVKPSLEAMTDSAVDAGLQAGAYKANLPPDKLIWSAIAFALLRAVRFKVVPKYHRGKNYKHSNLQRRLRYAEQRHPYNAEIKQAIKILRDVPEMAVSRAAIRRTKKEMTALLNAAAKMAAIFDKHRPTSPPQGGGGGKPGPKPVGAGSTAQGATGNSGDAKASAGEMIAQCGGNTGEGRAGSPDTEVKDRPLIPIGTDTYATYRRIFDSIVDEMLQGESAAGYHGPVPTGSRINYPHRLLTDGVAFSRRIGEAENAVIGLCLDTSGSMRGSNIELAGPIAAAFADSVREGCVFQAWTFGSGVKPIDAPTLRKGVRCGGGTPTNRALDEAVAWMRANPAPNKYLIVITDGEPDDGLGCQLSTKKGVSAGINVLGLAMSGCQQALRDSMPGARVIDASNPLIMGRMMSAALRTAMSRSD